MTQQNDTDRTDRTKHIEFHRSALRSLAEKDATRILTAKWAPRSPHEDAIKRIESNDERGCGFDECAGIASDGANEAGALPDMETFYMGDLGSTRDGLICFACERERENGEPMTPRGHGDHIGWYYDPTPGNPVGEFVGPFATEAEAVADAQNVAQGDADAADDEGTVQS